MILIYMRFCYMISVLTGFHSVLKEDMKKRVVIPYASDAWQL